MSAAKVHKDLAQGQKLLEPKWVYEANNNYNLYVYIVYLYIYMNNYNIHYIYEASYYSY